MTKKPWETEDWHKAKGVVAEPNETNSALARRDYSVPCKCHSENLIQVVAGYWIWWCSTHHQPKAWCENAKTEQAVIKKVEPLVEKLFTALQHADLSNGVEYFGVDEGRVRAKEFIDECEAAWQNLKSCGQGETANESLASWCVAAKAVREAKELRRLLQALVDVMNTEHANFVELEAAIIPLWQRAEQILAESLGEPKTPRPERGEMEQMAEHHKHLLAEETLRAHNMSTLFSYRHAFILGLEKAAELATQKTSHKEEQQK